ncbi:unnamed protein product, partial [Polarella glacialis]
MDRRTDMPPMSVFQKLARESGGAGGIDSLRFGRLLRCFRDDLTDDHLRYLWLMVDKDRSGLLTADEFADIFGCTTGILQSAAAPAAPRAPLTEEYFGILCGRLLRYLRSRGLQTLEEVIRRYDADGDGRVSKAELEAALTQDAPNLSQPERTQFIARLDADNDGVISAAELQLAFSVGEGLHGQSEKRALEMFSRIRAAITRSSQTPNQVFAGLCRGQPSMSQVLFEQLVKGFCPDLEPVHVQLMWQLVDKNNDGSIVFEEFVRYFGAQSPAVTQMPARPQPPPIDTSASPSRPPPPAPGAAVAMPQAPRDKLLLESIRRLIAKHGKQPAQFFQGMDVNRDGKLSAEEFAAGLIGLGVGEAGAAELFSGLRTVRAEKVLPADSRSAVPSYLLLLQQIMPLIIQYFLLALGPALAQGRATCKEAGCSGHGSCGLLGSCLCEGSWAGRDCSFQLSLDGDDDLVSLTAEDSQESPDDDTDVLFGPSSTIAEPPPLAVDFLALRPGSARAQANRENTPYETDVLLDPPSAIPAPPAPVEFLALRPGSSSAQAKSAGSPKKTSHQLARDAWAAADRLFAAAQVENARDASQRVKRAILLARSKKGSIPGHEFAGLQATSAKGSANGTTRSCAMDCSSRGLCLSGSCVCNSGFFGKGCESVRCADDCSGNGYCYQGLCQCNGNYSGANCAAKAPAASTFASLLSTGLEAEKASKQQAKQQPEVKTCPLGCSGRGTCSAGICACNEPWAGRACEDAAVVAFAEDAA